jgi:hypothetical protein
MREEQKDAIDKLLRKPVVRKFIAGIERWCRDKGMDGFGNIAVTLNNAIMSGGGVIPPTIGHIDGNVMRYILERIE